MRTIGKILAAAAFLSCVQAQAATITITVQGVVASLDQNAAFWDDSVTGGTAITAVFQIDTVASGFTNPTLGIYHSGPAFSVTFTLGDYTFSGSSTTVYSANDPSISGDTYYEWRADNAGSQNGLNVTALVARLVFANASDLPGLSLADIAEHPLDQFQDYSQTYLWIGGQTTVGQQNTSLYGAITSYTVDNPLETPEPSTWALLALGAGAAGFLGFRRLRLV